MTPAATDHLENASTLRPERRQAGDILSSLEQQARRFGSAFIAPAELIIDDWPTGRLDWRQLQCLRTKVGLSLAALLYRG